MGKELLDDLESTILKIREIYEESNQESRREMIADIWTLSFNPTVGFVADVVNRSRMQVHSVTSQVER